MYVCYSQTSKGSTARIQWNQNNYVFLINRRELLVSRDKGRLSCQLRWLLPPRIHICFFDMIAVEFVLSYSIAEGYNACAAISNVSFTDGYPTQQCWFPYCLIRVKLAIPKSEWLFSSRRIHGAISLGIWFQMNYHYQYQQWIVWDWAYIFCYILRKKIQIISLSSLFCGQDWDI